MNLVKLADVHVNLDQVLTIQAWGDGVTNMLLTTGLRLQVLLPLAQVLLAIGAHQEEVESRQVMVLREALLNVRGRVEVEQHEAYEGR
jgi:hypothetical protein